MALKFDDHVPHSHKQIIYFDNNSTTPLCKDAEKALHAWGSCANPSSDSSAAQNAKTMLNRCIQYIQRFCNAIDYAVIFTSGATESNCTIIRMVVNSYITHVKQIPHIIISSIEHHSLIGCVDQLVEEKKLLVTKIAPNKFGKIAAKDVQDAIKRNTCLVSIIYANNELGTINNVRAIGDVCKKRRIPFHTDAVQAFGKYRINVQTNHIDALSASFHKFHGPKGVGLLLISNSFIRGYQLKSIIVGSQQGHLRGGTENVPAIIAGIKSLVWVHADRERKNRHLQHLSALTMKLLGKILPIGRASDYLGKPADYIHHVPIELILLGPPLDMANSRLPNTLLIAIAKNAGTPFCNIKFKRGLDSEGVIISIGSSCLSDSPYASHVISAINAPKVIKRGVLRISFADNNTDVQIRQFVVIFAKVLKLNS